MRVTITLFDDSDNVYEGSATLSRAQLRPKARGEQFAAPSTSLSDRIISLRDEGFFAEAKTALEVHDRLMPTYPCDLNRVEVALLRLHKRRELRKVSKVVSGRKKVAYAV